MLIYVHSEQCTTVCTVLVCSSTIVLGLSENMEISCERRQKYFLLCFVTLYQKQELMVSRLFWISVISQMFYIALVHIVQL